MSTSVDASERISHTSSYNTIELNWEVDAEKVEVFNESEEIDGDYDYDNSTVTLKDLDPNTPYDLTVVYYKDEEVIDFDFLKLTTDKVNSVAIRASDNDNRLEDVFMDVSYIDDEVHIEWDEFPNDEDSFTILRNDEEIGTTEELSFIDSDVDNGSHYTYSISTKKSVSDEVLNSRIEEAEDYGVEVTEEIENDMEYDYYNVSASIIVPLETLNAHFEHINTYSLSDRWGIQYTTFIPDPDVSIGFGLLAYLEGDDRGFNVFSNDYRTRTAYFADFSNQRAIADPYMPGINSRGIDIGETVELNSDGSVKRRATQTDYNLDFRNLGTSSTASIFEVDHSVGIPISIFGIEPPAIDYYYAAGLQKGFTPTGVISGYHDRAPNHEIALYQPESDVALDIYNFEGKSFQNLWPFLPPEYFTVRF